MQKLIIPCLFTGLITMTSTMPFAKEQSSQLHSFLAYEVASLNWGRGARQVALDKAPANNFGPQRLVIDEAGKALYLLDATNQRIWIFNLTTHRFSFLSLSSKEADDFCVLDNGEHVYMLFSRDKKIVLYNQAQEAIQTYKIHDTIRPIGIQCDATRGLIVQAFDGNAYRHNEENPLEFQALVSGGYAFHAARINPSQGSILLHHQETNLGKDITVVSRQGELDTFTLIGVDSDDNSYLSVEVRPHPDSSPQRFLRKYAPNGDLVAESELAYSLYAYTVQDLVVTPMGEVYQMVPHKNNLKIVKWHLSTNEAQTRSAKSGAKSLSFLSYSKTQNDDFEPSEATVPRVEEESSITRGDRGKRSRKIVSRQQILDLAKNYTNARFYVKNANVTRGKEYIGYKEVITPISHSGWYRGMPYKWCGFDSLSSFQEGLKQGKKAGDKCVRCRSRYCGSREAVGVDCSGLVSRAFRLKHKYGTYHLPKISTRLRSKNALLPGDILNKPGSHVQIFSHRDAAGRFCVYEASSKDWKVSKRCYHAYQVKEYQPYRYKWVSSEGIRINRKKPTRFYIYGPKRIKEGQSRRYQAKVFYSDGSRRDVTRLAKWRENSRFSDFKGATLQTQTLNQSQSVYIKASYTESGKTVVAGINVKILDTSAKRISFKIIGPSILHGGECANYRVINNHNQSVSPYSWVENSRLTRFKGSGRLCAKYVYRDQSVQIQASVYANSKGYTPRKQIRVRW